MLIYDIYMNLEFNSHKIFKVYNFIDDNIKGYWKPELSMIIRKLSQIIVKMKKYRYFDDSWKKKRTIRAFATRAKNNIISFQAQNYQNKKIVIET